LANASKQSYLLLERLENVRVEDIFVKKAKQCMEDKDNSDRLHLEEAGIKQVLYFVTEEFRIKAGTTVKIEEEGHCLYSVKDISDSTKTGKLSLQMHPIGYPLQFCLEGSLIDQYCTPPANSILALLDDEKVKRDTIERLEAKINSLQSSFDLGLYIATVQRGSSNLFTQCTFNLGKYYTEGGGYSYAKRYSIHTTYRNQIIVEYERSNGSRLVLGKKYNTDI